MSPVQVMRLDVFLAVAPALKHFLTLSTGIRSLANWLLILDEICLGSARSPLDSNH